MKQILPTNFVDDIVSDSMGGKRRFNLIPNDDGTYSLEDVTEYDQLGSQFGSANINATNNAVNESADKNKILETLVEINATTEAGYMADALAVKELNNSLSSLNQVTIKTFNDISVEVVGTWTKVAEVVPSEHGMYFVIVSITIPTLTNDTEVTVAVNGVNQSNSTAILANSGNRRLQAVGLINISDNYPTISIQAFSGQTFTCTFATINYVKLK